MEFTIEANGIRLSVDADFDLDLTYVQDFLDSLVPTFEFFYDEIELEEDEEEDEDGVEYDEDGVAWWFDDENEEWYYFDEDEDDWVAVE